MDVGGVFCQIKHTVIRLVSSSEHAFRIEQVTNQSELHKSGPETGLGQYTKKNSFKELPDVGNNHHNIFRGDTPYSPLSTRVYKLLF